MNAAGFPILSALTWLPLVGAGVLLLVRGDEATVAANARWTALWTSLIVFLLSLVLWQESVWHWPAEKVGLAIAPGPFMVPVTSLLLAGPLIARFGAASVAAAGLSVFAAGVIVWAVMAGPQADLALAEEAMLNGDYPDARRLARRAEEALPPGPLKLRAQDLREAARRDNLTKEQREQDDAMRRRQTR